MSNPLGIPVPNTNRGLDAPNQGLNQPSFGIGRGLPAYDSSRKNWQSVTSHKTNGRDTMKLRFQTQEGDYQRNYGNGELMFRKNQHNTFLPRVYNLSELRYLCNLAMDNKNQAINQKYEFEQKATDIFNQRRFVDALASDQHSFLTEMDSFNDNIAIAGLGFNPPEPYFQNGETLGSYGPVSVEAQLMPIVHHGHAYHQNIYGYLDPGQVLWVVAKPMVRNQFSNDYYDPFGSPRQAINLSEDISIDPPTAIDFEFYSNRRPQPPPFCSNPKLLCHNFSLGPNDPIIQPPRSDRCYFYRDQDGCVQVGNAAVWKLGKNLYRQDEINNKSKRDGMKKRYLDNDHRRLELMEVYLEIKKLHV